ncbi:hypothetical protein ACXU4B_09245 [Dyella soli]|uniref:Multidrug transporter n=1 Tax=Dyella soli TaxID=522319 RepID=A0A4R0YVW2_9GAMM|nr:hypothetical protein [Dyella soli]TCI11123.1 hypothetical protein EZM97_20135 [Dyella soli]
MNLAIVCYATFLATLLTGAQIMFKLFAINRRLDAFYWPQYLPLTGALTLYFAVFVIYAHILKRLPLSLLYPTYTALSVLLTYAASTAIFREQVTVRSLVGCVMLVGAVYLIASPASK